MKASQSGFRARCGLDPRAVSTSHRLPKLLPHALHTFVPFERADHCVWFDVGTSTVTMSTALSTVLRWSLIPRNVDDERALVSGWGVLTTRFEFADADTLRGFIAVRALIRILQCSAINGGWSTAPIAARAVCSDEDKGNGSTRPLRLSLQRQVTQIDIDMEAQTIPFPPPPHRCCTGCNCNRYNTTLR